MWWVGRLQRCVADSSGKCGTSTVWPNGSTRFPISRATDCSKYPWRGTRVTCLSGWNAHSWWMRLMARVPGAGRGVELSVYNPDDTRFTGSRVHGFSGSAVHGSAVRGFGVRDRLYCIRCTIQCPRTSLRSAQRTVPSPFSLLITTEPAIRPDREWRLRALASALRVRLTAIAICPRFVYQAVLVNDKYEARLLPLPRSHGCVGGAPREGRPYPDVRECDPFNAAGRNAVAILTQLRCHDIGAGIGIEKAIV